MQFTDAVVVAGTRRRLDGYLIADARVARTGIQTYAGWEVGKPDMPIVKVFRPEAEVFSRDTLASFAHRPVTVDHPDEMVTADNWKSVAVGQTADEIARDGQFIRVPLMVADAEAIAAIEDGKRELSTGYLCKLVWDAGVTPEGEAYDAVQTEIRANHIAIVSRGRAGQEVRIGDGANKWGASPVNPADRKDPDMPDNLRKVLVDGLQVETTDAGAQAIAKLLKDLESSAANVAKLTADHAAALAAKDADLAKKDAEIDGLKAKILSDADLDKRVAARADLIAKAKAIAKDVKTDGLSDAAIRKAAVTAALGDAAVKDKADAYIDARFDILVEDAAKNRPDAFRQAVQQGVQPVGDAASQANDAWSKSVTDLNAWRKEA
jgi:hypothetical protein